MLALTLWATAEAGSRCIAEFPPEALEERLERAEAAMAALDVDTFLAAVQEGWIMVPCLDEPLTVPQAAHLHRVEGLRRWVDEETERADQALRAARSLDPLYVFPDELLDPGHELRTSFEAMSPALVTERVDRPREGTLYFDGLEGTERPVEAATLWQLELPSGAVQSSYLFPGEPGPDYDAVSRRKRLLWGTTAGLAAGALASYGTSAAASQAFWADDPAYASADLDAKRALANASFGVSLALGIGAATTATLAILD